MFWGFHKVDSAQYLLVRASCSSVQYIMEKFEKHRQQTCGLQTCKTQSTRYTQTSLCLCQKLTNFSMWTVHRWQNTCLQSHPCIHAFDLYTCIGLSIDLCRSIAHLWGVFCYLSINSSSSSSECVLWTIFFVRPLNSFSLHESVNIFIWVPIVSLKLSFLQQVQYSVSSMLCKILTCVKCCSSSSVSNT